MTSCPDEKLIARYIAEECTLEESRDVKSHLAQCERCRKLVQAALSPMTESDQVEDENSGKQTSDGATKTITVNAGQGACPTESMPGVSEFEHSKDMFDMPAQPKIDGYDILDHLPRGGQAIAYKAYQKATKRIVAVKVLLQGPNTSPRHRYRFEREVDLAASLQHPNIVTIYDSGIAQGQYYYAMEYIHGKPLDEYVESENLSPRETMVLFGKVCSAAAYAHQRGVMHRDLKPGNILVDAEGEPHILDFGLAKLVDDSKENTETIMASIDGQVIGTLAFMSPEQATGRNDAVDVRTDVYSIGVILYKVLTDEFPYDVRGSMLATLRNIQEAEPTRPSTLVKGINSEIQAILLKTLDKDPNRRYQSAAELQHDIDCWLEGLPITAQSDNSLYLIRKLLIRHRYVSAVVGLLLLIVFGFSYVSFDLYLTAERALAESESITERFDAELAKDFPFAQRRIFSLFLQAWHDEQMQEAKRAADYLVGKSKERNAAVFLSDRRPLAEKESGFRDSFSEEDLWFADFIVGECHLKNGDDEKALEYYRHSYEALRNLHGRRKTDDDWLVKEMTARLYELTFDRSGASFGNSETGGPDK